MFLVSGCGKEHYYVRNEGRCSRRCEECNNVRDPRRGPERDHLRARQIFADIFFFRFERVA